LQDPNYHIDPIQLSNARKIILNYLLLKNLLLLRVLFGMLNIWRATILFGEAKMILKNIRAYIMAHLVCHYLLKNPMTKWVVFFYYQYHLRVLILNLYVKITIYKFIIHLFSSHWWFQIPIALYGDAHDVFSPPKTFMDCPFNFGFSPQRSLPIQNAKVTSCKGELITCDFGPQWGPSGKRGYQVSYVNAHQFFPYSSLDW
jgi:hypothetical protein